ncbi:hypothetical protein FOL47_007321 [Perkinsus chesapeaki]|uniref:Uncharacterized protein n=1 Tax=Perkinsus chesapeaki TaxID=330153 RepID=A0A7J6MWX9_PERCH|nr:hypothetical protein FOL47_007321 [Perkinsus chesapeaki]
MREGDRDNFTEGGRRPLDACLYREAGKEFRGPKAFNGRSPHRWVEEWRLSKASESPRSFWLSKDFGGPTYKMPYSRTEMVAEGTEAAVTAAGCHWCCYYCMRVHRGVGDTVDDDGKAFCSEACRGGYSEELRQSDAAKTERRKQVSCESSRVGRGALRSPVYRGAWIDFSPSSIAHGFFQNVFVSLPPIIAVVRVWMSAFSALLSRSPGKCLLRVLPVSMDQGVPVVHGTPSPRRKRLPIAESPPPSLIASEGHGGFVCQPGIYTGFQPCAAGLSSAACRPYRSFGESMDLYGGVVLAWQVVGESHLLVGTSDGIAAVWDAVKLEPKVVLCHTHVFADFTDSGPDKSPPALGVVSVAYHGGYIVTGATDGVVRLWKGMKGVPYEDILFVKAIFVFLYFTEVYGLDE